MRLLSLSGIAACLLLWSAVAALRLASPLLVPSPLSVLRALGSVSFGADQIWSDLGLTTARTLASFTLSVLVGVPVGLTMGFLKPLYRSLEFLVDFLRSIPPIALFPLFLLAFGAGETAKVGVALYGCALIMIINCVYGVLNAPSLHRILAAACGLSEWQILWKIVLPGSLPQVFVGMRTALSLSLVLIIVVEMSIGSESGLGRKIYDYHLIFDAPRMYAAIILTGVLGYSLNRLFLALERRILHWAQP